MSTRNATITVTPVRHEGRVIAHSAEVSINGRVVYGTGLYGDGTARGMAGAMRVCRWFCDVATATGGLPRNAPSLVEWEMGAVSA
jgi:hypothetical protein